MPKNIVLDTNVLLHDPRAVYSFTDADIHVPLEVIEELDTFKRDMSELGRNARSVAQTLDKLRRQGHLGEGVKVNENTVMHIDCALGERQPAGRRITANRVDQSILSLALSLRREFPERPVLVVTKNVNLRLKADALGIPADDYSVDAFPDADVYTGWHVIDAPAAILDQVETTGFAQLPDFRSLRNQYAALRCGERLVLGRFGAEAGALSALKNGAREVVGIAPANLQQRFALDALLDDKLHMVTMTGKAGTGKTLLAVAAGLRQVFADNRYNRLLVFRPTMPMGRDIGYLPGDIAEKMRPWMQPVYDALELIREHDRKSPERCLPPDIFECPEVSIEPLTYIRGRSIPRQFIVIDEAQNITPLEAKTIITRVGRGTKIVLTGDPHQIDNPYIDAISNGLAYLIDRFRGNALSAHIGLLKGERSVLAETAANLL